MDSKNKKEENSLRKELQIVNVSKSYSSAYKIAIISVICVTIASCIHYIYLNQKVNDLSNRIVVLDSNGLASSGEIKTLADKDVVDVQVKAAISYAVPFLYSFNSANYDDQIEKGLKLFGNCGKIIHTEYINTNVREKVFNSNLEVACFIDPKNIQLVNDATGIHAQTTINQTFTNGSVENSRKLVVKMDIIKTKISDTNPFGYLIENWVILNEIR